MTEATQNVVNLVEYLVVNIVDDKDAVEINSSVSDGGELTVNVRVADSDAGHVIGREGHTINAIRRLARACATKAGFRVSVEIVD